MIERGIGYNVCRWAHAHIAGFVQAGDRVVLTTGVSIFIAGTANLIRVLVVE